MASYKRNADLNRDALFGSSGTGGSSGGRTKTKRQSNAAASMSPSITGSSSTMYASNTALGSKSTGPRRTNHVTTSLTGAAKVQKMKEAEEYRKKAKSALTKKLFSSPDPIAGAMFYHRAAEAYKLCGENRLERLHRIASGDCQLGHGAFNTAAQEYMRAAELSEISDETKGRKRAECTKLYRDAADAYKESGELARSGECMLKSAFSLLIGGGEKEEGDDDNLDDEIVIGGTRLMSMDKDALGAIEVAIERHVPDPLNRYKDLRQTSMSAFVDPEKSEDDEDEIDEEALIEMCRNHIVTASYTNETLFQAVKKLVEYGEFKSALYANGAITALLEHEGFATISLSRSYCIETILALALGDVVTADKHFLQFHLQNNNYLTSRECKLAEDLIRAVKMRDADDMETARDPNGENRAAMANLDPSIRALVSGLKISGAAKKSISAPAPKPVASSSNDDVAAAVPDTDSNAHNELDDLMNDMGLGSDDEGVDSDDDFDLR